MDSAYRITYIEQFLDVDFTMCDGCCSEGLNNNQQTRETDGETSGQSGDVHRALDTDAYSGIQVGIL